MIPHQRVKRLLPADNFGYNSTVTNDIVLPALRVLYDKWFRVTVRGARHIPLDGPAMLVANHSGVLPLDALMTTVAVHNNTERPLRMLGADLVFDVPGIREFAQMTGQVPASRENAYKLLDAGELIGVWPEGFRGLGKPFNQRYNLQRFARAGFAHVAVQTGVPIIPVTIFGAEEIYPKIADATRLAQALKIPYFPITPFFPALGPLGLVPLPSKWTIEFGEPIDTAYLGESDVPELALYTRARIQRRLNTLLRHRKNIISG
jgi:1-acyl-sn-glycerol-3-phosphate acyltransferase